LNRRLEGLVEDVIEQQPPRASPNIGITVSPELNAAYGFYGVKSV